MKIKQRNRKTDALVVLLLFGVFAVCILSVLLSGADVYQRLADRDRLGYDYRTAGQYLSTRVRQADRADAITVRSFGDADALVLTEEIAGEEYLTLVYCHDGYLRELFTFAGGNFLPEDGEKVLRAQSLSLSLDDHLLTAELIGPEGEAQKLALFLRSGEEGAP